MLGQGQRSVTTAVIYWEWAQILSKDEKKRDKEFKIALVQKFKSLRQGHEADNVKPNGEVMGRFKKVLIYMKEKMFSDNVQVIKKTSQFRQSLWRDC